MLLSVLTPLLCAQQVETRKEIAQVLYAASATRAAAEKQSDEKLKAQRKVIAELQQKWGAGTTESAQARSE